MRPPTIRSRTIRPVPITAAFQALSPQTSPMQGRHPNGSRGHEPLNVPARIILEDDPGSQEPDAREGPLNGSARAPIMQVGVGGEIGAGHHGQRRPELGKTESSNTSKLSL